MNCARFDARERRRGKVHFAFPFSPHARLVRIAASWIRGRDGAPMNQAGEYERVFESAREREERDPRRRPNEQRNSQPNGVAPPPQGGAADEAASRPFPLRIHFPLLKRFSPQCSSCTACRLSHQSVTFPHCSLPSLRRSAHLVFSNAVDLGTVRQRLQCPSRRFQRYCERKR